LNSKRKNKQKKKKKQIGRMDVRKEKKVKVCSNEMKLKEERKK